MKVKRKERRNEGCCEFYELCINEIFNLKVEMFNFVGTF